MSSSSPATVPSGKPTAEDLLGQLLALIKGSQTISDFTPERLTSTMGQAVQFVKGDERRYRAFGLLTKDWSYGFGVDETKLDGRWFEFRFLISPIPQPPVAGSATLRLDNGPS
nr:hypothetical protein [Xanthomonas axonopodis]